ncbi:hypothetical protein [Aeoliella sp. SH292]|uniref:hypothetical protein n=1 Tax=Aeoliella sp. SH292 TaxID=3454464 RepID=UPI003F98F88F
MSSKSLLSNLANTRSLRSVLWLLMLALMLGTSGCGGCRSETPQERQARLDLEAEDLRKREEERRRQEEEKRKKQPFVVEAPISLPSDTDVKVSRVKRGHWMNVSQLMKSNYEDWAGETLLQVLDKSGRPVPIEETPFTLSSSRPVQLAKGRPRQVENVFLVPSSQDSASVRCTLRERNYGAVVGGIPQGAGLSMMDSYQYFFVVLAKEPNRYNFLKTLNGVQVPQDDEYFGGEDAVHYQVLLPDISKQVPLPDNPMCWTTVAYILWDEVDPALLDRERREALIDWLHWGGQIVINGPDSLKLLENSFLSPYLPGTDAGVVDITEDDVQPMARYWTDKTRPQDSAKEPKQLHVTRDWSGIELDLAEGVDTSTGLAASTGGLLVERQVGRGRIVVSRMQLAERDLLTWSPHYDDLFNAGIMRRLPREWSAGAGYGGGVGALHGEWAGNEGHMRDAQFVTHLRLFSRDAHKDPNATNYRITKRVEQQYDQFGNPIGPYDPTAMEDLDPQPPVVLGGIGSWNDFNATSNAARESLREAAGVQIPDASFVVTCLAVYLVVLVPINWFFFKALGRVEYAWIAAPIIAIIGTAVVVHQAQLDIGFARAQTEIALLEVQGKYPRAHLSRYTALYTSLSSSYDMRFDDPTAVAAPFPNSPQGDFRLLIGQSRDNVELHQAKETSLAGLQVSSSTTDMIHSEQMIALDGALVLDQSSPTMQVLNQSQFQLADVAVVRCEKDAKGTPRLLGCWIGDLEPRIAKSLSFTPVGEKVFGDERAKQTTGDEKRLNLEPMFRLALDPAHMEAGEIRLVGRVDKVLPGVEVTPSAAQLRGATLVVAHLAYAPLTEPTPDVNSPRDFAIRSAGENLEYLDPEELEGMEE